ncbi:beta strand repeat-containing protein [Hyalangium versicolor]|uniref:beta strand repeat-containing protein n=1 Tax=Hyalangium versicolor TaxID=2861190 RepID=UPI001CCBC3D6|nr:immune inhibitor A [Hyalangium versicolor]
MLGVVWLVATLACGGPAPVPEQPSEEVRSDLATASAAPNVVCTLPPTFAGIASVNNARVSTCTNTITWVAGTPACGGTLSYSVYRGTNSGFTPSVSNRIAMGVAGTSYSDDLNLTSGTTYYYVVRATEQSSSFNEDANTVEKSSAPTGAEFLGINYFDDLDGNRPANAAAYWSASDPSLTLTTGCHYQSATKAYRFGSASSACGGTYGISTVASLVLGGNNSTPGINGFQLSAAAISPRLTFNLWYFLEPRYDGAWLAYSTTSATGPWTQVGDTPSTTAPYISAGGYDDTLESNVFTQIWTGTNTGANGSLKQVSVDLLALAGQSVWFAFQFYSDHSLTKEGLYLDDVRLTAEAYATCNTRTPPSGQVFAYKVSGLPTTFQAGSSTYVTFTAVDWGGNKVTSYSGRAALSSSDPQVGMATSVNFAAGSATALVTLRTVGTQIVTAKDMTNPTVQGSGSTSVTPGSATGLRFVAQPAHSVAGTPIQPAVKVELVDSYGNSVTTSTESVTLALEDNPGGGTLSGTTTVTTVAGVATFSNLSINKTGTGYTLVASASWFFDETSQAFNITPAAPASLAFVTQPPNGSAGSPLSPAVQVKLLDAFGNATSSTADVTAALGTNPTGGVLSGTTTVAAVNGIATFSNLRVSKPGSGYTLRMTSGSLGAISSSSFNVAVGPATQLAFSASPDSTTAGALLSTVQVQVLDAAGNPITGSTVPVTLTLGGPAGGTLGGTTTVSAVQGVATFSNLFIQKAGVGYTVTAGSSGLQSATSGAFFITPAAAARLAFSVQPSNTGVGTVITPAVKVSVQDAFGNLALGATPSITLALATNPSGATLGGTTTVAAVDGVATFDTLSIGKAGSGYKLSAAAGALTSTTSTAFNVQTGSAARLVFTQVPTSTTAGTSLGSVLVELQDAQGNRVDASSSITLSLQGGQGGTLSGTTTVAAIQGVATFNTLSIARVGTGYQLKAQASGVSEATSPVFNITHGPPAVASFTVQPGSTQAGAAISPVVRVALQDAFGNGATSATDAITVTIGDNPGNGTLSGTKTVNAVQGVATFADLSINRAGQGYTLRAIAGALPAATSEAFNIKPSAAASFTLEIASSVKAGQQATLSATAYDAYGNLAVDYGGTVNVTSSDGAASFASTATFVGGTLPSFKVTFKSPGPRTVTLTDAARASLIGTAQVNVTSSTQPTVSVTEPAGGTTVSGQVRISATGVVDPTTPVVQLSIRVDGDEVASGTGTTVTGTWDSTRVQDGTAHTITAVMTYGTGNVVHSAPEIVTVRNGDGGDGGDNGQSSGGGCGATSSADAGLSFSLLVLAAVSSAVRTRRRA